MGDPNKKQLMDAAVAKDKADWKPLAAAKRFVKSTLAENPVTKMGKMVVDSVKEGNKNAEMNDQVQNQLQTDRNEKAYQDYEKRRASGQDYKKGGCVKMSKGGSASKRADGCCQRGKTRGKII